MTIEIRVLHSGDSTVLAPRVTIYDSAAAIPPTLEAQIRRLLHAEWPGTEDAAALLLIDPGLHPVHFVLAEDESVLLCP